MLRTVMGRVAPVWRSTAASASLASRVPRQARLLSTDADAHDDERSQLSGTATREAIQAAFARRASDALRYEYFAQRAELEAEVEAAHMFRSLVESCKQQAMGFMELMEEYEDAEFGSTLNNVEIMADDERNLAEEDFCNAARVAEQEQLTHIKEWFEDMTDAAARAANRLDFTASMLDAEALEGDDDDDDDDDEDMRDQPVDQPSSEQQPPAKK